MRKQLGIFASLFFLCITTLSTVAWADYDNGPSPTYTRQSPSLATEKPAYPSSYRESACRPSRRPVCGPRPVCAPPIPHAESGCRQPRCIQPPLPARQHESCEAPFLSEREAPCAPESCRPPLRCHYPNENELNCYDGITVTARNPKMCMLGEQYPLEFEIRACKDVCDVVVTSHLPEGVSFVRSQPEAQVEGRTLVWDIGAMRRCQVIHAKVWLRCECEGELCACFCATATPVRFCSLLCAKPILTCHKQGPEEACPGDPVHYTITVTNRGSCAAEDVVLTDYVPEGLEHSSCQRTLTFRLGTLEPCQSKTVNVCFTAIDRCRVCNTAVVTACNAESTSCQWCTNICKACVEISKKGPKEAQLGKNADYQIVVTNPGDKVLNEVIVTDTPATSTSIVEAPGASVNNNQAVWKLRELKPGEQVSFNLTLTTCVPGCFTNRVGVTTCQGCSDCAEFTTHWRGRPALNMQISSTNDQICIGDMTTYNITVVNQGSEPDNDVRLVVHFPEEVEPVNASGDTAHRIEGNAVMFAPFNELRPRQTINYRINGRARKSGDGRINAELSSASVKTPITQQESTVVN